MDSHVASASPVAANSDTRNHRRLAVAHEHCASSHERAEKGVGVVMAHRQMGRYSLAIDIRVVHHLSFGGRYTELPLSHGLSHITQVIVAGRQIVRVEASRLMQQLTILERPQLDAVLAP